MRLHVEPLGTTPHRHGVIELDVAPRGHRGPAVRCTNHETWDDCRNERYKDIAQMLAKLVDEPDRSRPSVPAPSDDRKWRLLLTGTPRAQGDRNAR